MKKITLQEKLCLYFGRYSTHSKYTPKQYLKVMDEARKDGELSREIRKLRDIVWRRR